MNQKGLSRFEALAQDLVEGKIGRLFGGRLEPIDVAGRLARVMEDNINGGFGPSTYTICLNQKDFAFLTAANPELADDISEAAWQIGKENVGERFERPVIKIMQDPGIRPHSVQITSSRPDDAQDSAGETTALRRNKDTSTPIAALLSLDAFLIIQGRRHVPLSKPIITLGRRTENDIVLAVPTVSRQHAQIRWRFGRFVLYDVSSRGKTMVNGHPVREHVLKSGDVIALSDVLLIYGEGHEPPVISREVGGQDNTKTFIRPSSEK